MKKLFTYLLISSMVVLSSCTNYDDQFDDLNSQLSTLKSQIEGFSALSSGITALQGTVSSLQSAVAALPKTATPATDVSGLATAVNVTALQTSLTALAAEVTALTTSLAGAATSAEVAALAASLATAQADLADLLAANNIYSVPVSIKTPAELDFAVALGDKLTIINESVTIEQTSTMDAAKLQGVMSKMTSVIKFVKFTTMPGVTTTAASFDKLTSALSIEITQQADVSLPVLATTGAFNVVADNKITAISAPKLTSMSSLTVNSYPKVTSFDMSSLLRFPAGNFSLTIGSGTADFSSVITTEDTVLAAKRSDAIEIDGATIVKAPLIVSGNLLMDAVLEPNFPVWEGQTGTIFNKAKKVVLPAIKGALAITLETIAPKATYFHYIGNDGDSASTTSDDKTYKFPSFVSSANTNIETLIIGGSSTSVSVTGATDLTSFTITGGTHGLTLDNNDSMTSYVLGHTSTIKNNSYGSVSSGSLVIKGNSDITSVTADLLDDIATLTITTNASLDTLSFAVLNSIGTLTTGAAVTAGNVNIHTNDLTASNIQLPSLVGELPAVAGKITTASGITALSTFIGKAVAVRGTAVTQVMIDNVTTVTSKTGTSVTSGAIALPGTTAGSTSTTNTQNWAGEDESVYLINLTGGTAGSAEVPARKQLSSYGLAGSAAQTDDFITIQPNGAALATVTFDAAFKAKYGITATFVGTDFSTWATSAATELNAQLDAGSYAFDVEIANDFGKTRTYILNQTWNGSLSETAGTVSQPLTFTYGGVTLSGTVGEDSDEGVHEAIVAAMNASSSALTPSYLAATVTGGVRVTPRASGLVDYSTNPTFSTFGFAGNYSKAASLTSFLGISSALNTTSVQNASGWRITTMNNSYTVKANLLDLASAASHTTSSGTTLTELVDGTSISGTNNGLQRDWTNATALVPAGSATGVLAVNITSWL